MIDTKEIQEKAQKVIVIMKEVVERTAQSRSKILELLASTGSYTKTGVLKKGYK